MCLGDTQEKLLLLYRLHLPPALPLLLDEEDVEIGVEADQYFDDTETPTSEQINIMTTEICGDFFVISINQYFVREALFSNLITIKPGCPAAVKIDLATGLLLLSYFLIGRAV